MSRIFLSHSSTDNFAARALADWLASEGWADVFLDIDPERGIAAGQRWERALHQAADRCEAVVFLITRAWLASGWCRKEYELARSLNKQLFAVIVERSLGVADLPPELKDTWQVTDLSAGPDHRIFRATLPSSDEERHVSFSQAGLGRLRAGLKKAGLDPATFRWPPEGAKDPAPYVGLRALGPDEAGLFFGRDADLVKALDRLRGLTEAAAPRIAVILGASGAGKSSFLRAGLLPRMARDDAHFLCLPAIRPGRDAIEGETGFVAALDAGVTGSHSRADIRAAVAQGANGVRALIAPLVEAAMGKALADRETAKPPVVVIPIDQAEELFDTDVDGAKMLALLADLVKSDAPAVMLLFAIRSDAYDLLERAKSLEGLAQLALPLLPMPRHATRAVIEGPAARYRENVGPLDLDPRLTQSLLDDLDKGGGRDTLPLLAFKLEHLWREHGRTGALRLAHDEGFGVGGAIEAGVKRTYLHADQDPRIPRNEAARDSLLRRGLVPWLAGIDPETKAPRRNVARAADIPAELRSLINLLVEERLLSRSVDEARVATIEPAHEALLRQWGKLGRWLDEDFPLLATLEGLQRASRDWDANARTDAWLSHRGQRLAEAAALDARPDLAAKLGPQQREYLAACRAHEEAQRAEAERVRAERESAQARALADAQAIAAANRRVARRTGIGAAVALALAIAAGGAAIYAKRQADFAAEQQAIAVGLQETAEAEAKNAKAQQAEVEKQKERAEAQAKRQILAVEKVTKIVASIAFDVSATLRKTAAVPVDARRALIDPVSELGGTLIKAGESSTDLQRDYAAALNEATLTYLAAGDLEAAAKAAEQELEIYRAMVRDGAYAGAKRDLGIGLERVGQVKARQNDFVGALQAYEEEVKIARDIARETADALAQRDLSYGLERLGEVKAKRNDFVGAMQAYEESVKIDRDLARQATDPATQGDLARALQEIGGLKAQLGDLVGALQAYEENLKIVRDLARDSTNTEAQSSLRYVAGRLGDIAYTALTAKDFQLGFDASDLSLSAINDDLSVLAVKAGALMFLRRSREARATYLGHRGEMVNGAATWEATVLQGFEAFRKAHLTDPLMDEITTAFASAKKS